MGHISVQDVYKSVTPLQIDVMSDFLGIITLEHRIRMELQTNQAQSKLKSLHINKINIIFQAQNKAIYGIETLTAENPTIFPLNTLSAMHS